MKTVHTAEQLDAHEAFLAEKVFQIYDKWPHFRQLLTWIRKLAETTPAGATVVSLERTLLYGGISLVAPFFNVITLFQLIAALRVRIGEAHTTMHWLMIHVVFVSLTPTVPVLKLPV